jgi:copper(I)-binding protein
MTSLAGSAKDRRARWIGIALAGAIGVILWACRQERVIARQGDILVTGAYAHPSAGDAGAVYVQLRNTGTVADTLVGVGGPDSSIAMLMTTSAGHMAAQPAIVLAAGARLVMQPGGVHVMFSGLTGEYRIGDTLRGTLRFARAGTVSIAAPVVPFGEMPE